MCDGAEKIRFFNATFQTAVRGGGLPVCQPACAHMSSRDHYAFTIHLILDMAYYLVIHPSTCSCNVYILFPPPPTKKNLLVGEGAQMNYINKLPRTILAYITLYQSKCSNIYIYIAFRPQWCNRGHHQANLIIAPLGCQPVL